MKFAIVTCIFLLNSIWFRSTCFKVIMNSFGDRFQPWLHVTGIFTELQCDHNQLVCPLQNISYPCVVTGTILAMIWRLNSQNIALFNNLRESTFSNINYFATGKIVQTGLSSNLSFSAELQSGPVTLECKDGNGISNTWSHSIVGRCYKPLFFLISL